MSETMKQRFDAWIAAQPAVTTLDGQLRAAWNKTPRDVACEFAEHIESAAATETTTVMTEGFAELTKARTAAANARREALREADQLASSYLVARRPEIEVFVEKLRELRAASQPAADTQGCSDPGCGQCACQSSRVQPSAETQAHPLQNICADPRIREHLFPNRIYGDTVKTQRQPPGRDVEGLARVLAEADGTDWGKLDDETFETYKAMSRAAIAFMDGGPRT